MGRPIMKRSPKSQRSDIASKADLAMGSIDSIEEVSVNGESIELGGYLDIGLIDTMHDMMVETLGALMYAIAMIADRERHPVFVRLVSREEGEREIDAVGTEI